MKDKIVILGARSGTSLMLNLLAATGKFRIWSRMLGPDKYAVEEINSVHKQHILREYPDHDKIAEIFPENWDLAKYPGFCFCIPALIKKFHPKFIVMDRSLEGRVQSMLNTFTNGRSWVDIGRNEIFSKFPNITNEFDSFFGMGIQYLNDDEWERWFTKYQDWLMENALLTVPPNNVLRVDFCEFMYHFEDVMEKVKAFLGLKYHYPEDMINGEGWGTYWDKMRDKRFQNTSHDISYWVDGEIP